MKLTEDICKVIADMEYLIGSECYNPSSYDGWNDIEGCAFRYPVNVLDSEGKYRKIRSNINKSFYFDDENINEYTVNHMKYKFGANEMFVGKGLARTLEYLEERYGLNFNELEKKK